LRLHKAVECFRQSNKMQELNHRVFTKPCARERDATALGLEMILDGLAARLGPTLGGLMESGWDSGTRTSDWCGA
jgi:hypothetical protein